MLTEAEFVEQQRSLGRRIHEHDGVFWEEVYRFYCKPAFIYRSFERGSAKPHPLRRLLGYSHQVTDETQSNRRLQVMMLERSTLDAFGIQSLPGKKRNKVRRALENCQVSPINPVEGFIERMREINISQTQRESRGAGAVVPLERYTDQADDWRRQIRAEARLPGREWWGAFVDGELGAYLRTYQVDGIRVIQQTKAHTDYLKKKPVDALYFHVLSQAADEPSCQRIVNGGVAHPSLNRFKEQFLFRPFDLPMYSSSAWLVDLYKRRIKGLDD